MNIQTPAARNTDPATSHLAAQAITKSGLRHSHNKLCLKAVQDNPGVSSARIAQIAGIDRHQAARRLSDIAGISVEKGEPARCDLCRGQLCVTWWPMNNQTTIGAK